MAQLELELQKKVDNFIDKGSNIYDKGNPEQAILMLKSAWDLLPRDKFIYDDSYHIARYIIKISLELQNYNQAKEWAETIQKCDPERPDIGEKEFILGQVLYESGNKETAKFYIEISNQKSKGQCFRGKNKKYKNIIR
ncbi:MAG: hypothetical protein N4A74_23020 [Carboxylicivirga sp.]|jgi:tetratricopeptide (TPR) repeat protein|nr:hypothetical protein [Carboxylicivirga sp.]